MGKEKKRGRKRKGDRRESVLAEKETSERRRNSLGSSLGKRGPDLGIFQEGS